MVKQIISAGLIVIALVGCGETEDPNKITEPVDQLTINGEYSQWKKENHEYTVVYLDGMPCVIFSGTTHHGGFTCDWSKHDNG